NTEDYSILDKSLYYSLEKIAENMDSENKHSCIIVYGSLSDSIDSSFNSLNAVYKFTKNYDQQIVDVIDIFIITQDCISVLLNTGENIITRSEKLENKKRGYSLNLLTGEAKVTVYEKKNNHFELINSM